MPKTGGKGLRRMFGGTNAEKKWKDNHKEHISNENQQYYKNNKAKIHAKRKETRIQNKPNKILGF